MGSLGGFRAQSYICAGGGCRFFGLRTFGLKVTGLSANLLVLGFHYTHTYITSYIHTYIYMYILTLPVATNEQEDECFRPEG